MGWNVKLSQRYASLPKPAPGHIPLMIDSGAFSVWKSGAVIDLDEYIGFCLKLLARDPRTVVVNLDVIGDGKASYQNWKIMREAGVPAMPIYHPGSDVSWLHRYLNHTDHVGLGGLVGKSKKAIHPYLDRLFQDVFCDPKTRLPRVKVHGMGVTTFYLMHRYPWHSVDSTSWMRAAMYGRVMVPRRVQGRWNFDRAIPVFFSSKSGELGVRGAHYTNMAPAERQLLLAYLKLRSVRLGFQCPLEGDSRAVVFDGAMTSHWSRMILCLDYYADFVRGLPWPRPFLRQPPVRWPVVAGQTTTNTTLYASGSCWPIELHIAHHPDRMANMGVLLSYNSLTTKDAQADPRRLRWILKHNRGA